MCMRHILICGMPDFQHFSTLFLKRYDFRKIAIEHQYVFRFSLILSEIHFILRRNERYMIKNQILNIKFNENHSSGSRVVPRWQKDGGTDMLIVAFLNFAITP
jgi:hypothetical protein